MGAVAMAIDDVETMERGGVRCKETKEDTVLLQPLVHGGAGIRVVALQSPRLASLDVFRGLSIAVCLVFSESQI